jgi:Domain of unknown function (DUF4338)
MAHRLSADWQQVYRHPLYFLETFVDPTCFRGTCYRAANWILLGSTTGRGKDDVHHNGPNRPIKQVLGYPYRDLLQTPTKIWAQGILNPADGGQGHHDSAINPACGIWLAFRKADC